MTAAAELDLSTEEGRAAWGADFKRRMDDVGAGVREIAFYSDYADNSVKLYLGSYSTKLSRVRLERALEEFKQHCASPS